MKQFLLILALTLCCATISSARQQKRWHQYSLTPHLGFVAFPAVLDDRGPYAGATLDGSIEAGISLLAILSPGLQLEGTLSSLTSSAGLANTSSSSSYLDVDVDITTFWLTVKCYPSDMAQRRSTQLWYGCGLHAGIIEEGYRERLYLSGAGYYTEAMTVRSSALIGAHAVAGVDIYPHRNSAICLTAQARMNLAFTGNDFSGSLASPALLLGLRWDFGLNAN